MSRQQRLTLVATILGSTVVFLDATVVNVALPAISDDLDAGLAGQQWVVEAYMLTMVSLLLVGGSLGDQFGRRRMFVAGLVGFGATSALCAIAPVGRVPGRRRGRCRGSPGRCWCPGSLAIVAATFEGAARGKAVGTWTAWTGIATVLGPAGGGALIGLLSWRAIFWVNLPLIAVTVLLTLHAVEESRDPDAFRGIDWVGIGLSAAGLGGPVFALIEQPTHGWGDPLVWVPLIGGIACFALFLLYEARARHPMLDLGLFRIRNFAVANLTTLAAYAGLIGGLFFVGLYLQQVVGYTPLEAGLATTPISILLFVLSPRFGRLASGTGPRLPMTAGPIVAGLGLLLMLRVGADADYLDRRAAGDPRLRPRPVGDGGAADRDRARLGRGTPGRDRLRRQQRRLAGGGAAGDRRARRGDLGPLRLRPRRQPRRGAARARRRRRRSSDAKAQPLAVPEHRSACRRPRRRGSRAASADASTSAFHLGVLIAGLLMIPAASPPASGSRTPSGRRRADRRVRRPAEPRIGCPPMAAPIIFSGIQPTGRKHLGNYIGAIRQYVEGQDRGEPAIFCIVDLHAISVAYDPAELRERLYDTTAILLAAGLDPERCIFFRQSDVREHTELTWLLSAVTAHGDLNRMTQFKDKSARQRELVSAALFFYPVLMAADVLAYRATEVPVGDDQRQHVELMREIARRFNERFGETLVVPELRDPRGRRPDHGPAGAGAEDVDHRRHRGRHRLRPRRARRRSARSSAAPSPTPAARSPRRRTRPGSPT